MLHGRDPARPGTYLDDVGRACTGRSLDYSVKSCRKHASLSGKT
jgi:hypothetical protein